MPSGHLCLRCAEGYISDWAFVRQPTSCMGLSIQIYVFCQYYARFDGLLGLCGLDKCTIVLLAHELNLSCFLCPGGGPQVGRYQGHP
jgi:hypothetical protein